MLNTILEITIIILLVIILAMLIILLKTIITKKNTNNLENTVKLEISILKQELENKLSNIQKNITDNVNTYIDTFTKSTSASFDSQTSLLRNNLESITAKVEDNTTKIDSSLGKIIDTLNISLTRLQDENSKKLEEMRKTVDEKLDTTLNARLNQSFKMVQENLSKVEERLGEMKTLASGVGDLKKVLSNVKTRGIWGEMQLSQILEEILTKDQYRENIITKPKSLDPVEFAIKLPGNDSNSVYLPIDSKFPLNIYEDLVAAKDSGDKEKIDRAKQELARRIKVFAKDIKDKYIEPPYTTDFGIMFLPTESLYAEVISLGLIDELQVNYRVAITGPTTLAALLSSLQIGFRTLAIEKRSSEVWTILSAVKTEFKKFETTLTKAQKKLGEASDEIENLVGTRTRQINRKLNGITYLSNEDAQNLLDEEN